MDNPAITRTLNDLIIILKDADQGFHAAAEEVRDTTLKTELHGLGQMTATIWGEFQNEVRQLGAEPREDGSFTGKCKRIWMEIKTAFTDKDETVVLKDCLKAQEAVHEGFEDALKTEALPSNVKSVIGSHFETVQEITQKVRTRYQRFFIHSKRVIQQSIMFITFNIRFKWHQQILPGNVNPILRRFQNRATNTCSAKTG